MWLFYDFIFTLVLLVYLPYMLCKGKLHSGFWARFGFWSKAQKQKLAAQKNIWLHAVSVGEVLAVMPLLDKIRQEFPHLSLVISTVTRTGHDLAQKKFGDTVTILYAPMDFSAIVHSYIRWINPRLYITVETEIWPNLFCALKSKNIPIVLVNGRISDTTFPRYRSMRVLLRPILHCVTKFCMQSKFDAQRIIELGAEASKVEVVGNVKFDDLPTPTQAPHEHLVVNEGDLIWIAGSTHPGEEEIILDVYQELRNSGFPKLRLILAPRHIERTKEVEQLIQSKGLQARLYSTCHREALPENTVVLVDVIGLLRDLYQLATIVFIGKTLSAHGGQNMIEPAFYGKAVIVGPYTENFKNVVSELLESKGIIQIRNESELTGQIKTLLSNASLRQSVGQAAKALVEKNKGVTFKTFQILKSFLVSSK